MMREPKPNPTLAEQAEEFKSALRALSAAMGTSPWRTLAFGAWTFVLGLLIGSAGQ